MVTDQHVYRDRGMFHCQSERCHVNTILKHLLKTI